MKLTVGSKVRWRILLVFFKPLENWDLALSTGMQVSNWPFLKQKLQDLLSSVMTTALLLPNVACMTGSFNERHLYCLIWLRANFRPFSLRVFVRQTAYPRRCNHPGKLVPTIPCWSTWRFSLALVQGDQHPSCGWRRCGWHCNPSWCKTTGDLKGCCSLAELILSWSCCLGAKLTTN